MNSGVKVPISIIHVFTSVLGDIKNMHNTAYNTANPNVTIEVYTAC